MLRGIIITLMVVAAGVGFLFVTGCETQAQTGAVVGSLGGAAIGALAGGHHHAGEGALIGAAIGAGGGYMVGNEADKRQMNQQIYYTQQKANTAVVNITNSNGSVTPVTLRRSSNVWVGPRGEQYMSMPTVEQLRPIYGM
jgi:uncharacterized protein YcfJ